VNDYCGPAFTILESCLCERRAGETLYETAVRVLTQEAVARSKTLVEAADMLFITKRALDYHATQYGLRKKDAKVRAEVHNGTTAKRSSTA
jgi:hypothetical protein